MTKHEDKYYENINYKLCIAMLVFIIQARVLKSAR